MNSLEIVLINTMGLYTTYYLNVPLENTTDYTEFYDIKLHMKLI